MAWSILLAPIFLIMFAILYLFILMLNTSYLFIIALVGKLVQRIKSAYAYVSNRVGW